MYRRNITHILVPMGWVLALLIGYHLLVKPSIQTVSAPTEVIEAVPPPPPPPTATPPVAATTSVRTLDHTALPNSPHDRMLETIRDEIEKRNLPLAETQLTALPPALLDNARIKSFVAVLWNNLGLQQEQLHGTQASVKAFKKAAALDDSNPVILMNLVHAYWEQRDPALNQDLLEKLIRLAPEEPFPHLAMADILQEQGQPAEAAQHLAHAADRVRKDPALQSYLASITEKLHHMESVESRMATRNSTHFTVKFDGAEDHGTWTTVLDILEDAYREIGQKFGHFPSKPIVVVLHTKESFQGATGSPAWADGLYDPTLGRIQVPTQGATTDTKWLTNVLRHEYVHALLHNYLGSSTGALPTWLNEGLAMQWAGDDWPEMNQAMRGDVTVIPLNYLEGSWGTLPSDAATLAYLEAASATRYLIDRWGITQVNELLKAFKARASVPTAIQNKLFVSYEQFHQQWLDSFRQKHS
ncbi:MAG: peptidase MA family metallohydrolase [Nitrospira sp.]|nr:peptidase MA family metallohydrolase [Nitrospira sp.]